MNGNIAPSCRTVFIWVLRAKFVYRYDDNVCAVVLCVFRGENSLLCVVSDCLRLYACGLYFVFFWFFRIMVNVHSFHSFVVLMGKTWNLNGKWRKTERERENRLWAQTNNFYSMRQLNWEIRSWLLSVTRRYTRSSSFSTYICVFLYVIRCLLTYFVVECCFTFSSNILVHLRLCRVLWSRKRWCLRHHHSKILILPHWKLWHKSTFRRPNIYGRFLLFRLLLLFIYVLMSFLSLFLILFHQHNGRSKWVWQRTTHR